jgi:sulfonate transport system substrate-binding protein
MVMSYRRTSPVRSRLARLGALGAGLLAIVVLASACSSSSGGGGDKSGSPTGSSSGAAPDLSGVTLRVGQTGWATTQSVLDIAGESPTAYKVDWSVFSGGDKQMQALIAGALDVATASEIPPIFAAAASTPNFKEVAVQQSNTLQQEVLVPKGSSITSISGLKGKKVAYVQSTTAQYFLYELLKQAGLDWTDITPVALAPADGVSALSSGSVDALATYGNSVIAVHSAGGTTIGSGQKILSGNFPWIASDSLLANPAQSAALVDLLSRINIAYAKIHNDPSLAQQYAQATNKATQQDVSLALSTYQAGEAQRPTTVLTASDAAIKSQQSVATAFTDLGTIPKVDVSTLWSTALNSALAPKLATAPARVSLSASPSGSPATSASTK